MPYKCEWRSEIRVPKTQPIALKAINIPKEKFFEEIVLKKISRLPESFNWFRILSDGYKCVSTNLADTLEREHTTKQSTAEKMFCAALLCFRSCFFYLMCERGADFFFFFFFHAAIVPNRFSAVVAHEYKNEQMETLFSEPHSELCTERFIASHALHSICVFGCGCLVCRSLTEQLAPMMRGTFFVLRVEWWLSTASNWIAVNESRTMSKMYFKLLKWIFSIFSRSSELSPWVTILCKTEAVSEFFQVPFFANELRF